MKRIFKTILHTAIALTLMTVIPSCSSNETPECQKTYYSSTNGYGEEVDAANNFMNLIYPSTRGTTRQVKNVKHMLSNHTRSNGNQDTLFTVVNYEDNAGFVLLSKSKNGYDLYAIDDSHSMEFTDTLFNDGLRYYLSQARANVWPGTGKDTTIVSPPITSETVEVVKRGPFLNQYVSNWSQWNPFNIYCPTLYDTETAQYQHCVTGCVPLAVAIVMSYHRWPNASEGHTFDWNAINNSPYSWTSVGKPAYDEIATLIAMLGNSNNLKTSYGVASSSTSRGRVPTVLSKWGYTSSGDWNQSTSADLSMQNTPSLMAGINQDSGDGHEWVCDGRMFVRYNPDSGLVDDTDYVADMYYHFVWGWGGSSNGFYKIGSQTGVDGDPFTGNPVQTKHLYVHLKCLTDIRPNK